MKKMIYWWTRLSSWMKLAVLVGVHWLLIVAGSAVCFYLLPPDWHSWISIVGDALKAAVALLAIISIRQKLVEPKIRPAKEGELLIVVAKFRGPESPDPQMYIARRLEADLLMHPALADRVRVSRFPAVIEEESREAEIERARAIGETYGATLVIWGEHDGHSAAPHYLVTRERERVETVVELEPTAVMADLDQFVMYVSEGLPETMTYLSFFTIGQMHYFAGEYSQALSLFSTALDHFPSGEAYQESAMALRFYRGNTYYRLDEHDLAIGEYDKAIELKPDYADAYNNRGNIHAYQGEYDQAIADFDRAIKLKPGYADAYNNRGATYYDKGEYDQAIADYGKAIELKPDLAVAYYNRGNAYYRQGEYDLAITDYDRAIELKPGYADAYNNRGATYCDKGKYDQAIADFDRAIELKPDLAAAYNNRGYAYDDLGEHEQSIADYNKAIELKPDYADAYYNRGNAYYRKDEYDLAITDYDRTIELKPDYAKAYYSRGVVHKMRGEKEDATGDFERFLELSEDEDWRKEAEEQLRELRGQ